LARTVAPPIVSVFGTTAALLAAAAAAGTVGCSLASSYHGK